MYLSTELTQRVVAVYMASKEVDAFTTHNFSSPSIHLISTPSLTFERCELKDTNFGSPRGVDTGIRLRIWG